MKKCLIYYFAKALNPLASHHCNLSDPNYLANLVTRKDPSHSEEEVETGGGEESLSVEGQPIQRQVDFISTACSTP